MTAELFGPDSVTWRVHRDPALILGGLRALFLQALLPAAMRGVAQNSDFRADPWGRLIRTAEFVGVTTFGTAEAARRAAARVRGIHRRLTAVDPDTGVTYRIDEPDLLLWVHCAEVDSYLSVTRRAGLRLSGADADRYVAEQVVSAELVGIDPGHPLLPRSVRDLERYFSWKRGELALTDEAVAAARFLLSPPMPAWVRFGTPAAPAWAGLATLGFALMPRWARRLYALPGLPTTDVGAAAITAGLRMAALAIPPSLRDGPHYKAAVARTTAA
ncbi:oxygenase MpaB family protein [Fodinicola acaciae]|uniref:oxygenase MpaB family protein n=1 Tax=Fodinicola acaciae TaxID=2681555 RepID=UPI0013D3F1B5|nr:oxygenase MpaB family protein [Fodinicola acaciae]